MAQKVTEMSREELIGELPRRLLVLICCVAGVMMVNSIVGFIAIKMGLTLPWLSLTVAVVLGSPFVVSRLFRWSLQPAQERFRRRRAMMKEALAHVSWHGGDSFV